MAAFVPLAFLRSCVTGHPWQTELAPITSPMFQLYIFFMITDPKTTTKARWSQMLVAVLVAVAETVCRLAFRDVHSLYHALFTVGPVANLVEIIAGRLAAAGRGGPTRGCNVTRFLHRFAPGMAMNGLSFSSGNWKASATLVM